MNVYHIPITKQLFKKTLFKIVCKLKYWIFFNHSGPLGITYIIPQLNYLMALTSFTVMWRYELFSFVKFIKFYQKNYKKNRSTY